MCTRVFNNYNKKYLTTARNMDWATQMPTTIFAFKVDSNEDIIKSGTTPENEHSLTWTPRYNSIVTMVGTEAPFGASDGINSEGLVANLLYDSNATYHRADGSSCKKLDVLRWVQFVLDTCCSVSEVIAKFSKEAETQIQLIGGKVPGSTKEASLHLSVSDILGKSAIIEIHNGEFIIYNNKNFRVMTNEPSYAKQIELNQFWRWQWNNENNFPSNTLPGGPFPSDRFARASYYLNHLYEATSTADSLTQSQSVVMNASVPVNFKSTLNNYPNIAQTLWTSISSHNERTYYFTNARTMSSIEVDLKQMDLFPSNVSKLVVVSERDNIFINHELTGLQNENFKETIDPFVSETILV
ncbi:linear amide C-N hydrolase [Tenacibaculum sp. Mcav3-52]|uniref:linear amide C-N hydrolase n=1 Tax=unclassified Tenacibaculum TaxID=2635139 RepID=UPI001EF1EC9C|nr:MULTISPECIES: linear amide C-N hydrolase [unclassified Tenacibaculum]MCG7503185.1 linear amide C-N hydrolase [Tenacibaculum sp. Mcav3-52]MCO7186026.1 linear amide C-N hydrolase [Tenacibaculum sp. XPcli2-G]BFF37007.1 linear amide C-N hydrolase [Tenacibaculum mesophilum]BFF40378.1 linear amide C-N hydrolase [Tenacibaculum mesophilum]